MAKCVMFAKSLQIGPVVNIGDLGFLFILFQQIVFLIYPILYIIYKIYFFFLQYDCKI